MVIDRPDLFAPALAQADLKSDRSSISPILVGSSVRTSSTLSLRSR